MKTKVKKRLMMADNMLQIWVRSSDKERMMTECKEEFLAHHPEFRGAKITHNFMFRKLVDYYLEE